MMKPNLSLIILLFALLAFNGCSKHNNDEIKTGMTYAEVEKLFNKPASVLSGIPDLVNDYSDTIKYIKSGDTITDKKRWLIPKRMQRTGNSVTWTYPDRKNDTFYVMLKNYHYTTVQETTTIKDYYVSNMKVSQLYYNSTETPAQYKKIIVTSKVEKKNKVVKDSPVKNFYIVSNKFCVVFDPVTGKVTNKGYFPLSMSVPFFIRD